MTDYPINPHQMLNFDWEQVVDKRVSAVLGRKLDSMPVQWEAIAFVIGDTAVVVSVEIDTDQLFVANPAFGPDEQAGWATLDDLSFAVGLSLGWCWEAQNYLGYLDGFMLAFSDELQSALTPRCMLLGEGSLISILKISEISSVSS